MAAFVECGLSIERSSVGKDMSGICAELEQFSNDFRRLSVTEREAQGSVSRFVTGINVDLLGKEADDHRIQAL